MLRVCECLYCNEIIFYWFSFLLYTIQTFFVSFIHLLCHSQPPHHIHSVFYHCGFDWLGLVVFASIHFEIWLNFSKSSAHWTSLNEEISLIYKLFLKINVIKRKLRKRIQDREIERAEHTHGVKIYALRSYIRRYVVILKIAK